MKLADLVRVRWLLSALLIVAAVLFLIGAATESDSHAEKIVSVDGSEHNEAGEQAESPESPASSETVLGLNLESTPLVVLAGGISVALAAATWLSNHKLLLVATALFAAAFAVLDTAELVHQIDKSAAGLAALAAIIAVLHAAAAVVAERRSRATR